MSDELSKRVDDQHDEIGELRHDVRSLTEKLEHWAREVTILTTSMAALQRRQVEKTAHWSRVIEVIATASFVFSAIAAGFSFFH